MKHIRDNIYEHKDEIYFAVDGRAGECCMQCALHTVHSGCKIGWRWCEQECKHKYFVKCVGEFTQTEHDKHVKTLLTQDKKNYKGETNMKCKQMTEKEIIQYWVNNREEMRVFKHAPLDCRLWLKKNPQAALILHQDGYGWYKPCDVFFDGLVYTIPEDILKEKESGFIEFEIDDAGKYTLPNGGRPWWEDQMIHTQLHDTRYLFAGWFFENKAGAGWSIFQMGETETGGWTTIANDWVKPLVPKKIRFYKGV